MTTNEEKIQLADPKRFIHAGNATFTLVSMGSRFTYRVRQKNSEGPFFVSLLTGSDNEGSYSYLGMLWPDKPYRYVHGRKSKVKSAAPPVQAFGWYLYHLGRGADVTEKVKIYHAGRCGRCGRKLTVPESIMTGLGPECSGKVAM